jgi:hypothetical protein
MQFLNSFLLGMILILSACSSTPPAPQTGRAPIEQIYRNRWQQDGKNIKVLQVREERDGIYWANGMIDGRPREEYYDSQSKQFSKLFPGQDLRTPEQKTRADYKELLGQLASDLSSQLTPQSRIAIVDFYSQKGDLTELSRDIALKLESHLVKQNRDVIDRGVTDRIFAEHHFQQTESALMDPASVARIGKLLGVTILMTGKYNISERTLNVSAKFISIETAKVLAASDIAIPLDGDGTMNNTLVNQLAREKLKIQPSISDSL